MEFFVENLFKEKVLHEPHSKTFLNKWIDNVCADFQYENGGLFA